MMSLNDSVVPVDFDSAVAQLRKMIAARELVKDRLAEPPVSAAFELIGATARYGEDGSRLEAVSVLGKAAEISQPVAKLVQPLLKQALQSPLPRIGSWGTADDRKYLAKGMLASDEPWIAQYAAIELARGDTVERSSRDVWAQIAIKGTPTLAETLQTVARALSESTRSGGQSVDTASRKLIRIAAALRDPVSLADTPIGEGFGKAFSDLVSHAGGREGPESRQLREETAKEAFDFLVQVLRLKFAIAFDTEVYRAAGAVLGWWKPAHPPKSVTSRAERILSIAMEALHTLARQGVAQRNLRQALVAAFGSDQVNRAGVAIMSNDPSLDSTIASWLSTGRELSGGKPNLAVRDLNEREVDVLVANLLLAVEQQEGGPQPLELVADELEVLEPVHAATIRAGAARSKLVRQWAQAIGGNRGLFLSGERGEVVQYDPSLHESEHDLDVSATARIRTPAVLKRSGERSPKAILKAFVEKP